MDLLTSPAERTMKETVHSDEFKPETNKRALMFWYVLLPALFLMLSVAEAALTFKSSGTLVSSRQFSGIPVQFLIVAMLPEDKRMKIVWIFFHVNLLIRLCYFFIVIKVTLKIFNLLIPRQ